MSKHRAGKHDALRAVPELYQLLQCIRTWTEAQRAHPAADADAVYRCPLCKAAYASYVWDSQPDKTFQCALPKPDLAEMVGHAATCTYASTCTTCTWSIRLSMMMILFLNDVTETACISHRHLLGSIWVIVPSLGHAQCAVLGVPHSGASFRPNLLGHLLYES